MFKCNFCHRNIGPRISPIPIVTQRRRRTYPNGSIGWEIVKELNACQDCADSINSAVRASGGRINEDIPKEAVA